MGLWSPTSGDMRAAEPHQVDADAPLCPSPEVLCAWCGNPLIRPKRKPGRTCSHQCAGYEQTLRRSYRSWREMSRKGGLASGLVRREAAEQLPPDILSDLGLTPADVWRLAWQRGYRAGSRARLRGRTRLAV